MSKSKSIIGLILIGVILASGIAIYIKDILSTATKLDNECTEVREVIDTQIKVGMKAPTAENLRELIPIVANARTICNRVLAYFKDHQLILDNIYKSDKYYATDKILTYELYRQQYDQIIEAARRGV